MSKKNPWIQTGYFAEAYIDVLEAIKSDMRVESKIILTEALLIELEAQRPTPVPVRVKMVRYLQSEHKRLLSEQTQL